MDNYNGLILLLGSPNTDTGQLLNVAKERCEVALAEYKKKSNWKLLLTGGYGEHFNRTEKPHAEYLKQYLVERGIPEYAFVEYAESKNTLEDASLSKPTILKYDVKKIIIITSDYHLDRAKYIFNKELSGLNIEIDYLDSKTNIDLCEMDIKAQINHEKESLKKMKLKDGLI